MSAHITLGPGKEFDAIRGLLSRWGNRARLTGDDAAVVDVPAGQRLVVSTDVSVENVHFRRAWLAPDEIGWRATTAALSDLAAMAAQPLGLVVAMTVPDTWRPSIPALGDGVGAAADAAGCPIVGGDLSGGTELSLCITVLGSAAVPMHRNMARPGHTLWVTGSLGAPGNAVQAWVRGESPSSPSRARFAHPVARIREASWLAAAGCVAAIDISDGLVADARHIAAASNAHLEIELGTVPRFGDLSAREAVTSGEEYELLVAGPDSLDAGAFARTFGIPLTRIGTVRAGDATVAALENGMEVDITAGYDHFQRG